MIKKEILELRDKGSTIIFSTHNMESVEEICDDIALINKSRKILEGKVSEVKEAFKSNVFEIVFVGNMMAFSTALWTAFEILEKKQVGNRVHVKIRANKSSDVNELLQIIVSKVQVISVHEITPSMNDIFIQKVQEVMPETLEEEVAGE